MDFRFWHVFLYWLPCALQNIMTDVDRVKSKALICSCFRWCNFVHFLLFVLVTLCLTEYFNWYRQGKIQTSLCHIFLLIQFGFCPFLVLLWLASHLVHALQILTDIDRMRSKATLALFVYCDGVTFLSFLVLPYPVPYRILWLTETGCDAVGFCNVLCHRQFETVIPTEDSVITEMTLSLRDWGVMWKQLYVVSLSAGLSVRLRACGVPG